MSLFDKLPEELLDDIGHRLESEHDIAALVRSSRRLFRMFNNHLYLHNEKHNLAGALSWAAARGREETLFRAHEAGVRISAHPRLLALAVSHGHLGAVKTLLSFPGIDLSHPSPDGKTPLGLAVSKDSREIVRLLVDHGVDVNQRMGGGWTPAILAANLGRVEILRSLLDHGADPNAKTDAGQSPLLCAGENGFVEVVELLLERGADIATENNQGWTCLHCAAHAGRTRVVELLLDRGASVSQDTLNGWTALLLAASMDKLETLQLLMERGADVNVYVRWGETALMMAADRNRIDVMTLLLDHGASTSSFSTRGRTCLMIAAAQDFDHAVELLLRYGADVNMASPKKWTALMEASYHGSGRTVRALLEKGADIEATDEKGWTALFAATYTHQQEVVRLLLDHGAERTLGRRDRVGQTPAIWAAHVGATPLIKVFVRVPTFDADVVDNQGRSAFFHAAMRGWPNAVRILLPHSKTANSPDRYGTTPIFAATRNGHHEVVELLISQGFADMKERDMCGKTLLATAMESENETLIAMLRMHAQRAEGRGGEDEGEDEGEGEGEGEDEDEDEDEGEGEGEGEEDEAGIPPRHRSNHTGTSTCWCDVCCRYTLCGPNVTLYGYSCRTCEDGRFLVCSDCVAAGFKCHDEGHRLWEHKCWSGCRSASMEYYSIHFRR